MQMPQPLHVEGITSIIKNNSCKKPQVEIPKRTSRAFSAFVSVITPTAALAANIRRITCRLKQYIIYINRIKRIEKLDQHSKPDIRMQQESNIDISKGINKFHI